MLKILTKKAFANVKSILLTVESELLAKLKGKIKMEKWKIAKSQSKNPCEEVEFSKYDLKINKLYRSLKIHSFIT